MNAGDFFGLVAAITGVVLMLFILTSAYKRRLDYKERELELRAQANATQLSRQTDRNELLEERVRVLERIATDRGHDVAVQIEALRGRRESV